MVMTKGIRCLKCKRVGTPEKPIGIGCEVFDLKGGFKGYICQVCASRPPKYKMGIKRDENSYAMGKKKGRKKKKKTIWDEVLEDMTLEVE
jgi:hypothetical protein